MRIRSSLLAAAVCAGTLAACGGASHATSAASGAGGSTSGSPSVPAAETSVPAGGGLTGALLPVPTGFEVASGSSAHNGPLNTTGFDTVVGTGASTKLGFHDGAEATYQQASSGYTLELDLFRFATAAGAGTFASTIEQGVVSNTTPTPRVSAATGIADGIAIDATGASTDGVATYGVIAVQNTIVMITDYSASFAAANLTFEQAAAQLQFARLPSS
jgi:hypothetical protein